MNVVVTVILAVLGIEDLRTKTIPVWMICVMLLAAVVCGLHTQTLLQYALGILPGLLFILFSLLGIEIGVGDGLITLAYGLLYGWKRTCIWLMYSFFLVTVIGLVWKVFRKKKKLTLPFVPFMTVVHMGMCI